jgi:hypothetical protein
MSWFEVYVASGGVVLSAYFLHMQLLFSYLKRNHPSVYSDLGSPVLFLNETPMTFKATLAFLYWGGHRHLNDPKLNAKCARIFGLAIYVLVALFTLIVHICTLIAQGPRGNW